MIKINKEELKEMILTESYANPTLFKAFDNMEKTINTQTKKHEKNREKKYSKAEINKIEKAKKLVDDARNILYNIVELT